MRKKLLILGVLALGLAPIAYRNLVQLYWLRQVFANPNVDVPAEMVGSNRFWGAVLLKRGDIREAENYLLAAARQVLPGSDRLTNDLLFSAYISLDDQEDAAKIAGETGMLEKLYPVSGETYLRTDAALAYRTAAQKTLIKLAANSRITADLDDAQRHAQAAFRLTDDTALNAAALIEMAEVSEGRGDLESAATLVRLSANLRPWQSANDPRLIHLARLVGTLALREGCFIAKERLHLGWFVLYLDQGLTGVSGDCRRLIWETVLANTSPAHKPFLYAAEARRFTTLGDEASALKFYIAGERIGLSPAWRDALSVAQNGVKPLASKPNRDVMVSTRLSIAAIDLIELDLGLPVHVLIGDPGANDHALWRATVINMAPTLLDDRSGLAGCGELECLSISYAGDIYGAAAESREVVKVVRPVAWLDSMQQAALALGYSNTANPRTGLRSHARAVTPGKVLLQAGWVRASGGRAYLGWRFFAGATPLVYGYSLADYGDTAWRFVNRSITVPENANSVELWQLNFDASGTAQFSGVLFAELQE